MKEERRGKDSYHIGQMAFLSALEASELSAWAAPWLLVHINIRFR